MTIEQVLRNSAARNITTPQDAVIDQIMRDMSEAVTARRMAERRRRNNQRMIRR